MYVCQLCKKVAPAHTKAHRVVVETRPRQYPYRSKANEYKKDGRVIIRCDSGGEGREIIREVIACPECADQRRYSSGFP